MKAKPGEIRDVIDIDIPRPRDETSDAFGDLRRELLSLLESPAVP